MSGNITNTIADSVINRISDFDKPGSNFNKNILPSYRNNRDFLNKSNIAQRLNTELYYIDYNFNRANSTIGHRLSVTANQSTSAPDVADNVYINPVETKGQNYPTKLGEFFSINSVDVSIPGTGQTLVEQNIFNVVKAIPSGLDNSYKNEIVVKIIENNNLKLTQFLNSYLFLNNSVNSRVMRVYPDELKFQVFLYPLLMDMDAGVMRLSASASVIVFDGCQFISFNDWDFDISGTKSDISLKDVAISYEKKYITNRDGMLIRG